MSISEEKSQDAKPTQIPAVTAPGGSGVTGDYFLHYMFLFPHKELSYFYRRTNNQNKKERKENKEEEGRRGKY